MSELLTFQDAVDTLLDEFDLERTERNLRIVRRATAEAMNEVVAANRWAFFDRHHTIWTVTPYSTGTIAYDHTGGTYECQVTLSGGTWPTWAQFGKLVIDDRRYEVSRRVSDTVITLHSEANPGADVAAGTSFSIERSQYTLPDNFRRHIQLFSQEENRYLEVFDASEVRDISNTLSRSPSTPRAATILSVGESVTTRQIEFAPTPDAARSYDLFYEALPRRAFVEVDSAGTVVVSSGASTVTGTSTAFSSDHVGAIIRLSANSTDLPTSLAGHRSLGSLNRYRQQRVVVAVASTTSLTVDEPFTESLSGVKYTISDPIDLEPTYLVPAFLRIAENYISRAINAPPEAQGVRNGARKAAIRLAMENCLVSRAQGLPCGPPTVTLTTED